jgi:hypothetical protein
VLHLLDVVPVDRADVADAERLEEVLGLEELAERGAQALHAQLQVLTDDRHLAEDVLDAVAVAHVGRLEAQVGQAAAEARDRRRVGPAVVVEHDHHAAPTVTEVVDALVGHAAGHRSVADDGNHAPFGLGAAQVEGGGHAVRVAEDGGRVAVLDPVVLGLFA